jgi:hypothetical protein
VKRRLQGEVTLIDNRDGSVTLEFENLTSLSGRNDNDGPRRQYASAHIHDGHSAATLKGVFNIIGAEPHG